MKEMPQKKGFARLILPQGLGFYHSLCPGGGECAHPKNSSMVFFAPGGWSRLELTDT